MVPKRRYQGKKLRRVDLPNGHKWLNPVLPFNDLADDRRPIRRSCARRCLSDVKLTVPPEQLHGETGFSGGVEVESNLRHFCLQ